MRKCRARSRCCPRSLWDLAQELLLCDRYLTNLQLPKFLTAFMDWFAFELYFIFFPSFFFFSLPKSKEQGALRESSVPWMTDRLADVGRSSTVPLTFFPGLAVPLQCVGRTQAPVYSRIPKSCFVFSFCLLLQLVPGSVRFFLLEFYRLGEGRIWIF